MESRNESIEIELQKQREAEALKLGLKKKHSKLASMKSNHML